MSPEPEGPVESKGAKPGALILVVDDEPEVLAVIAEALACRGYRVATAAHGKEALAKVEQERPQLILLDMRMPVMDGWTFAKALREHYGRSIPIVAISAAEDSRLRADEIGADGDLGKPFALDDLYEIVQDTIGEVPA